jgi:hypothetical protein
MGEAKRKRLAKSPVIYHHTSTLRTNLIWMSGVIELEGESPPVIHPHLGEIRTDPVARRAMKDFPSLAWFTTQITVPASIVKSVMRLVDNDTGEIRDLDLDPMIANSIALNRVAIGFPVASIPVMPWSNHPGYTTAEGKELNESAIEAGDDPLHWYVSSEPVDVLKSTEIWCSLSMLKPKLARQDWYLRDVHNMVRMCRGRPSVYIPPTWLKPDEAKLIATIADVPVVSGAG